MLIILQGHKTIMECLILCIPFTQEFVYLFSFNQDISQITWTTVVQFQRKPSCHKFDSDIIDDFRRYSVTGRARGNTLKLWTYKMRRNHSNNVAEKDGKKSRGNINIIIIVIIWKKNAEQLILENRAPDKKGYWR